jgi:tetratricopeptide (TPR) repeat protein
MENIILTNKWKYPIYFSSLSGNVRETPLNLMDRLSREGLVLHLTPEMSKLGYNIPRTEELFFEVYKYDNLSDTTVAQNENASGIALAYPEKMLDYHIYLSQSSGDSDHADSALNRLCEAIPSYWRSRLSQRDMYLRKGDSAKAEEITEEMLTYLHGFYNKNQDNIFFHQFLGIAYYALGEDENAEKYLTQAWELNHDNFHTFKALLQLYAEQQRAGDMIRLAEEYKAYHEDDEIANSVLRNAQMLMQQPQQQRMPAMPPVQIQPSQPPVIPPPLPESGG